MTVTETVKETVKGALATSDEPRKSYPPFNLPHLFDGLKAWTAAKPQESMLTDLPPSSHSSCDSRTNVGSQITITLS